jgi:putative two-component system response regulator
MEQPRRILVVDDEAGNRELLEIWLTQLGYAVTLADDGPQALQALPAGFDLILLDVMMPGMDGFEVCRHIRSAATPVATPICMVTALDSKAERLRAVECGANDFIGKPVDKTELRIRTAALLATKAAQDALLRYQAELETTVARRTEELRQSLQATEAARQSTFAAYLDTLERLAIAAEFKDEHTATHIRRMSRYSQLLAQRVGLPAADCDLILQASPMHDVGKIGIPDAILRKPGPLDKDEWQIMQQHTTIGARILGGSTSPLLQAAALIARTHHEKWDGSGYPAGLAGEHIPLWGRIVTIADVFDALTTRRPYKEAFSTEKTLALLRAGRGTQFEPRLLDLFLDNLDAAKAIQDQYPD